MMPVPPARILRFGDFELDVRAGELRKHGIRIRLQDQSFQILLMLLDHPGEVVLREEIRKRLWPNNTIVEFDHSINAAIKRLRNALGESAEEPGYIETLAKRGYRFAGQLDDEAPAQETESRDDNSGPRTISHYSLINELGSGGMGVVYRAQDLKLGRHVAVKFLPGEAAVDPAARQRFEREARAASALNHPNICAIYGLEDFDGQAAIVMELVEGETLEARLRRGPLPLDQALAVAIQIAGALDEAHRKGIVHRDLKPANIMLTGRTSSGVIVKVLDFGIAKMESPAPHAAAANVTEPGVVMGTRKYMSPEQASGTRIDARSDIYSFGVVFAEMLNGPSEGDRSDPAPASVERVLRRCLEPDREDRWQTARDLKAELQWIADQRAAPLPPVTPPSSQFRWRRLEWIALGMIAALLISFSIFLFRGKADDGRVTRFSIYPRENTKFGTQPTPIVSPDGHWIALAMNPSVGPAQLWLRSLDSVSAVPLAGTEGVLFPFWSPDSRSIGFFANNKLMRIDLGGPSGAAPPITLCDTSALVAGGSWSPNGTIVFADTWQDLYQVRDTGGSPKLVMKADIADADNTYLFPWFLPDGRHFLFTAWKRGDPMDRVRILVGSIDSPRSNPLREAGSSAIYAQGHLLFVQDGTLMAQPFDPKRLLVTGDAARVAEHITPTATVPGLGFFAASESGPLVYFAGADVPPFELAWFDRRGNRLSAFGETTALSVYGLRFSPDQKTIAVSAVEQGNTDVWLYDIAKGLRTRVTFDPAREVAPVWSPDGRTIAFSSNRKGHLDLYRRSVDGTGPEELLYAADDDKTATSWSPDGEFLLFDRFSGSERHIWALPLTPAQAGAKLEPFSVFDPSVRRTNGQFSPDGHWIAYVADEPDRTIRRSTLPGFSRGAAPRAPRDRFRQPWE